MASVIIDRQPAGDWAEGFPLGNGRIGAMVMGSPLQEKISLNHDLLWRESYSGPYYRTGQDREKLLSLCKEEKWDEADALLRQTLPWQGGIYTNPFVPMCDLYINLLPQGDISDYQRRLDLQNGMCGVSFRLGDTVFRQECFCPGQTSLFVLRLCADTPVSVSGEVSLARMSDAECAQEVFAEGKTIVFEGASSEGRRFAVCLKVINRGGRLSLGRRRFCDLPDIPMLDRHFGLGYSFDRDRDFNGGRGASLIFDSCDEVILLLSLATDRESADPRHYAMDMVDSAPAYETLFRESSLYFSSFYNATRLSIPGPEEMDMRQARDDLLNGKAISAALVETVYNASRYIAIASGMPREGKASINLQGIWCRDTWPAWDSDYHLDLNVQMCYWPLAQAGLLSWYEPLLQWMERLLPQAQACARGLYGVNGSAYSGCCDPWRLGGCDTVGYGFLGAGAWLCQILWQYWEYAPSDALLQRLAPILREVARFHLDMLIEDSDGSLTYPFGASPEMGAVTEGGIRWIGPADVCDLLLTKELFAHMARMEEILGGDQDVDYGRLAQRIRPVLSDGEIGEWVTPQRESEPGHRHRSPFVCFCPGNSVTKGGDPDTFHALRKLLARRHEAGSAMSAAFSYAWDLQLLARFGESERTEELLTSLLRIHLLPGGMLTTNDHDGTGGLAWFTGHKVMQVEASIALIAAITEMILQDHNGAIELLPALPDFLPDGDIRGLPLRGGATADFTWRAAKPVSLSLKAAPDHPVTLRVRLPNNVITVQLDPGEETLIPLS